MPDPSLPPIGRDGVSRPAAAGPPPGSQGSGGRGLLGATIDVKIHRRFGSGNPLKPIRIRLSWQIQLEPSPMSMIRSIAFTVGLVAS